MLFKGFILWSFLRFISRCFGDCDIPAKFIREKANDEKRGRDKLPWLVSFEGARHICWGSIISEWWILTTATCLSSLNPDQIHVEMGAERWAVDRLFLHEQFRIDAATNVVISDIGLILLKQPIQFEHGIQPLCLGEEGIQDTGGVKNCWVWGEASTDPQHKRKHFQEFPVMYLNSRACLSDMNQGMICVTSNDPSGSICSTQYGSPLICQDEPTKRWIQTGVMSQISRDCSGPAVFSRVSQFLGWMKNKAATTGKYITFLAGSPTVINPVVLLPPTKSSTVIRWPSHTDRSASSLLFSADNPSESLHPPNINPAETLPPPNINHAERLIPHDMNPAESLPPPNINSVGSLPSPNTYPAENLPPPNITPAENIPPPNMNTAESLSPPDIYSAENLPPPNINPAENLPPLNITPAENLPPPNMNSAESLSPPDIYSAENLPPPDINPAENLPPLNIYPAENLPPPNINPAENLPPLNITPAENLPPTNMNSAESLSPPDIYSAEYLPPTDINPAENLLPPNINPAESLPPPNINPAEWQPPPNINPVESLLHTNMNPAESLPPPNTSPAASLPPPNFYEVGELLHPAITPLESAAPSDINPAANLLSHNFNPATSLPPSKVSPMGNLPPPIITPAVDPIESLTPSAVNPAVSLPHPTVNPLGSLPHPTVHPAGHLPHTFSPPGKLPHPVVSHAESLPRHTVNPAGSMPHHTVNSVQMLMPPTVTPSESRPPPNINPAKGLPRPALNPVLLLPAITDTSAVGLPPSTDYASLGDSAALNLPPSPINNAVSQGALDMPDPEVSPTISAKFPFPSLLTTLLPADNPSQIMFRPGILPLPSGATAAAVLGLSTVRGSAVLSNCMLRLSWISNHQGPQTFQTGCGTRKGFVPSATDHDGAEKGEFPWVVSFKQASHHFCAGAILNEWWIVTTASCANVIKNSESYVSVQVGVLDSEEEAKEPPVVKVLSHQEYVENKQSNNLGLVQLQQPLHMDSWVSPVCIMESPAQELSLTMVTCWMLGWTVLTAGPTFLVKQKIDLQSPSVCAQYWPELTEFIFCIEAQKGTGQSCKGDVGAPLVCEDLQSQAWVLVGILSNFDTSCLRPYVFTRVSHYTAWIEHTTTAAGNPFVHSFLWIPQRVKRQASARCVGKSSQISGRIIAELTDISWRVFIASCARRICVGSIISNYWILTSAQCLHGLAAGDIAVFHGVYKQNETTGLKIENVFLHWNYSFNEKLYAYRHNLALLKLQQPLHFSSNMLPVCLPKHGNTNEFVDMQECWVTGSDSKLTGRDHHVAPHLRNLHVNLFNYSDCAQFLALANDYVFGITSKSQSDHIHVRDVGAAVVCLHRRTKSWRQVGIVSHMIPGCRNLAMSTQVSRYSNWIKDITKSNSNSVSRGWLKSESSSLIQPFPRASSLVRTLLILVFMVFF